MTTERTRQFMGRLGGRGPAGRRGTVLIMVIAMLAALFIVGAAFLSAVTFESSSIARVERVQQQSSVIEGLSREVRGALKRSFLGDDGKAWNRESASAIGNDTYGEVAGVHPLVASVEPYRDIDDNYYWYQSSDLELALANQSRIGAIEKSSDKADAKSLVHVNFALGKDNNATFGISPDGWNEWIEGDTVLTSAGPLDPPIFRRDADGDGVWDSYTYRLPMDRFPLSKRGDLPRQLRQPDFDNTTVGLTPEQFAGDPNFADDTMFYALRVVPHGAMVDVGHAHRTLLEAVLGLATLGIDEAVNLAPPYVPEGEEPWLRRRFCLPPREPVLSGLQLAMTDSAQIPTALYAAFGQSEDPLDNRWWPINTGRDGDDITQIDDGNPGFGTMDWLDWVDIERSGKENYGFRQLITTVSHDDQLMRLGRSSQFPGQDWIDDIRTDDNSTVVDNVIPSNFSIDEWPDATNAKLAGRLKVSLPGLVDKVLAAANKAYNYDPTDIEYIDGIDELLALAEGDLYRQRLIRTIQDGFMLMLRNVEAPDPSEVTAFEQEMSVTAAALTANLIDFVDSDGVPTRVVVRNIRSGQGSRELGDVYGLERQPFITEIFALNSADDQLDEFAVEKGDQGNEK